MEKILEITNKAKELERRYDVVVEKLNKMDNLSDKLAKCSQYTNLKVYDLAYELPDVDLFNDFTGMLYEDYCFIKNEYDVNEKYLGRTSSFYLDKSNVIENFIDANKDLFEFVKNLIYDELGYVSDNTYEEIKSELEYITTFTSDFEDIENEIELYESFVDKGYLYNDVMNNLKDIEKVYNYIEDKKNSAVNDYKHYFSENIFMQNLYDGIESITLYEDDLNNPLITKELILILSDFKSALMELQDFSLGCTAIVDLIEKNAQIQEIEMYGIDIVSISILLNKIRKLKDSESIKDVNIQEFCELNSWNLNLEQHLLLLDFITKISY